MQWFMLASSRWQWLRSLAIQKVIRPKCSAVLLSWPAQYMHNTAGQAIVTAFARNTSAPIPPSLNCASPPSNAASLRKATQKTRVCVESEIII